MLAETFMELISTHDIDWFDNRDDAHEKIKSKQYDLVISDFNVPNGKFKETQDICKQLGLPLILVSGESWSDQRPCPHDLFVSKCDLFDKIEPAIQSVSRESA